jgi:hypothetical protein
MTWQIWSAFPRQIASSRCAAKWFPAQAEGEDLAQQRVGVQNGLRIIGIAAGIGRNQPGQVAVQRGDHLIVNQLVGAVGESCSREINLLRLSVSSGSAA